jgi:hypothetical protein
MIGGKSGRSSVSLSVALALVATLIGGCLAGKEENVAETAPAQSSGGTDTWTTIQRDVLSGCGCHQAAPGQSNGNVSYRAGDYADVANQDGKLSLDGTRDWRVYSIVKRYNAQQSSLYLTITGTAGLPTMPAVSAADQARILAWIQAGAPQ